MRSRALRPDSAKVERLDIRAYKIPTSLPEGDGTLDWDATILIMVTLAGGGKEGFGYSYASRASAVVITDTLSHLVIGSDVFDIAKTHQAMCRAVRNFGLSGIAACAISAVDNALWDLKAKVVELPMIKLLGSCRASIEGYGSGGFTTSDSRAIARDIDGWRKLGLNLFKIKIGRDMKQDKERVAAAVARLPKGGQLFVDANGAYQAHEAVKMAKAFGDYDIAWFEEPVPSADEVGLRFVRDHVPAGMAIAAGEYGFIDTDFKRLLDAGAVDVLQADATRCLGVTGFLKAAVLAESYNKPLSAHCAPALHVPLMCHAVNGIHLEYFHDHARIESMLFEGGPVVNDGYLKAQTDRPGFGFIFKAQDAERCAL